MRNPRRTLAVGLAAASVAAVFPFFAGGALLLFPQFTDLVVQAGLVPGAGPEWFGPVFGFGAVALAASAFIVSWKHKSFLVAGLLAASGILFAVPALIATDYLRVIVVPGPILGVVIGMGIFGLGVAKGIGTARMPVVTVR